MRRSKTARRARSSNANSGEKQASEREMGHFIRSMQRVRDHIGRVPGVEDYKQASRELIDQGDDLVTFARLYRHFGSWRQAQEMLLLSESSTPRRLEARMRYRQLGKVHRFTDQQLADALKACVEHYRRVPTVAEYDWWRDHELQKAAAAGDNARQLPSPGPFRRRHSTWDAALEHFGYQHDRVQERRSRRADAANHNSDPYLPAGLPVAEVDRAARGRAVEVVAKEAERAEGSYAVVVPALLDEQQVMNCLPTTAGAQALLVPGGPVVRQVNHLLAHADTRLHIQPVRSQAPRLVGTPSARYAVVRGTGGSRFVSIGVVLRLDRPLDRHRYGVLAAPSLQFGQSVPDRLFGGVTPGRIGRPAAHCYVAEAAQLRERSSVGSGRWHVAVNSAAAVISNTRLVQLKRAPSTAEVWTLQAAQRLGC